MANKDVQKLANWILLIGGAVHLVPALYRFLTDMTGGTPWIQVIVGAISVILALSCMRQ